MSKFTIEIKNDGDNRAEVVIQRDGEFIARLDIKESTDNVGEIIHASIDFAEYVYVNGKHWLDAEVADRIYTPNK